MAWLESPFFPSLLYVLLVAAVWLTVLAVLTPGTGFLELLALAAWVVSGIGALQLPLNPWALLVVLLGGGLFLWSLRRRTANGWLLLSGAVMAIGSAFLFAGANRVHPLVAIAASAATLAFFWLVVRKAVDAHGARPAMDPSLLLGMVGETRTTLDLTGSIQVGSELWTARAETPVAAGTRVKVIGREGLILTVSPVSPDSE
jgi:membrane-bound serine protease (ClpP class)